VALVITCQVGDVLSVEGPCSFKIAATRGTQGTPGNTVKVLIEADPSIRINRSEPLPGSRLIKGRLLAKW
jgi:hypothetical protein